MCKEDTRAYNAPLVIAQIVYQYCVFFFFWPCLPLQSLQGFSRVDEEKVGVSCMCVCMYECMYVYRLNRATLKKENKNINIPYLIHLLSHFHVILCNTYTYELEKAP